MRKLPLKWHLRFEGLSHFPILRDHPLFSGPCKSTESTLGGGGKSSCTLSKMLVLATVPVHEISVFYVRFSQIGSQIMYVGTYVLSLCELNKLALEN